MNKDIETIKSMNPHSTCLEWAETQPDLAAVWDNCPIVDWLFVICQNARPLTKIESVTLAVTFAEKVLPVFESDYPDDNRPRLAVEDAKNWLKDPSSSSAKATDAAKAATHAAAYATTTTTYAASKAAYAAASAAYAAINATNAKASTTATNAAYAAYAAASAAAYAAAKATKAAKAATNAYAATDAAYAAAFTAYAAATNAAKAAYADDFRKIIKNPFKPQH